MIDFLWQFFRFGWVGVATFLIYFILQFTLEKFGINSYVSLTCAYIAAIIFHFNTNRKYTFAASYKEDRFKTKIIFRYIMVNVLNYLITILVVNFIVSLGLSIRLGMIISTILTMISGFGIYKLWVFKE